MEHLGASGPHFWVPGGAEIAVFFFCNFAGIAKTYRKTTVFICFWVVGEVSELIFEVLEPLFALAGWSRLAILGLWPRLLAQLAGWLAQLAQLAG